MTSEKPFFIELQTVRMDGKNVSNRFYSVSDSFRNQTGVQGDEGVCKEACLE